QLDRASVVAQGKGRVMGIELDDAVSSGVARQHIAGSAVRIDSGKAALSRIQRSWGRPLNPETEKDVPVAVRGDRRVNEYRRVEAGGVGLVILQAVKHPLRGDAGAARIGIVDEVNRPAGSRVIQPGTRRASGQDRLINRNPGIGRKNVMGGE